MRIRDLEHQLFPRRLVQLPKQQLPGRRAADRELTVALKAPVTRRRSRIKDQTTSRCDRRMESLPDCSVAFHIDGGKSVAISIVERKLVARCHARDRGQTAAESQSRDLCLTQWTGRKLSDELIRSEIDQVHHAFRSRTRASAHVR